VAVKLQFIIRPLRKTLKSKHGGLDTRLALEMKIDWPQAMPKKAKAKLILCLLKHDASGGTAPHILNLSAPTRRREQKPWKISELRAVISLLPLLLE
jgi:hypothetical protein